MQNAKRILVAVDDSGASRRAVDYVAKVVEGNPDFHIGLLHLELPPRMLEWGGAENPAVEERVESERDAEYREMEKQDVRDGKSLLKQMQSRLTERGADVMGLYVQFQEPLNATTITNVILDTAKQHECGTVVVGRHSFTGLKRWFQHHVADELVRAGAGKAVWVIE